MTIATITGGSLGSMTNVQTAPRISAGVFARGYNFRYCTVLRLLPWGTSLQCFLPAAFWLAQDLTVIPHPSDLTRPCPCPTATFISFQFQERRGV